MAKKLPKLPQLLGRKIYKTGQTRGADDDLIYQNRVGRNSTVLIPFSSWEYCKPQTQSFYEKGFIVLLSPQEYFENDRIEDCLEKENLFLGKNAVIFYQSRIDWNRYSPLELGWQPATQRNSPLGGEYVARIPATTATSEGAKISRGFNTTSCKGAGIRVYEYASLETINKCRVQLEALVWLCKDSEEGARDNGMAIESITLRKKEIIDSCDKQNLLDYSLLKKARMIDNEKHTVCPLCMEKLSSHGFFKRVQQAEGREVETITITQLNLFHIEELRVGVFNHRPYNLGWGHHHCNIVVKDSGIKQTLKWMEQVINRNKSCTM